ncbi:hypothetical protein [Hydrogenophaga borbori]
MLPNLMLRLSLLWATESERLYFVRSKNPFEINGSDRSFIGAAVLTAFEALSSHLVSHAASVLPSPGGWL